MTGGERKRETDTERQTEGKPREKEFREFDRRETYEREREGQRERQKQKTETRKTEVESKRQGDRMRAGQTEKENDRQKERDRPVQLRRLLFILLIQIQITPVRICSRSHQLFFLHTG